MASFFGNIMTDSLPNKKKKDEKEVGKDNWKLVSYERLIASTHEDQFAFCLFHIPSLDGFLLLVFPNMWKWALFPLGLCTWGTLCLLLGCIRWESITFKSPLAYWVLYENNFSLSGCYPNKNLHYLSGWHKIFMSVHQCYKNNLSLMISSPHKWKSL